MARQSFLALAVLFLSLVGPDAGIAACPNPHGVLRSEAHIGERPSRGRMADKASVRIVVNKSVLLHEQVLRFRVQNTGSISIGLIGKPFLIERYTVAGRVEDTVAPDGFR
jgi:hypothetical protein